MSTIITYSLSEDLISGIASHIVDRYVRQGKPLSRLAFVFGGKRPSMFLKRELARRIGAGFMAPSFFPMDEFVRYIVVKKEPLAALPEIEAAYAVYTFSQALAPDILAGRTSFAQFLPWAREILSFIDHADREDIPAHRLVNVQRNAEIGYDVPESINRLLGCVSDLREAFHARMTEQRKYASGYLYLLASRYVKEVPLDEFDEIFFCNLFYTHATEKEVIRTLAAKGKASFFFQGDRKEWPVLDDLSRVLSCDITPATPANPDHCLRLYAGFDMHSQAAIVREILRTVDRPERTVVVVPDPEAVIPLLSEISPWVQELNVSLGYPVKRSSLYSLLELVFRAQNTRKGAEYYAKDYVRTISHPLVKNLRLPYNPAITRVLVHKVEEILLGIEASPLGGGLFVQLGDVHACGELYTSAIETLRKMDIFVNKQELADILKEFHDLLFTAWEQVATFEGFSLTLARTLDTLAKQSFLSSYPLNVRVVERLFDLIDEFKTSSFRAERFSQEDIFKIALSVLKSEMVSFSGSPLKGLQVLGVLEARSLNFENVIIMDVNESVLPSLRANEPLIPREVMVSLGLNRLEKEEEIQRYHFMRLISPATNVHLIYGEDKQREKSRFIEELIWAREKEAKALNTVPVTRPRFNVHIMPEKLSRPKTAEIVAHLKNLRYSPTRVNAYLECPLKFYFQYVLGLEAKEDFTDEPDSADIGLLVHDVLHQAFRKFVGRKPVIDEAFIRAFKTRLDRTFDQTLRKKMRSDAFLLKEILDHRMERFLREESSRPVAQILSLEESLPRHLTLGGQEYAFDARVDRIDKLEDGSLLVIDYKTGGADHLPRSVAALEAMELTRESIKETIGSFQLPLYVHHVNECFKDERVDAALYNLRTVTLQRYFSDADDEAREAKMKLCLKALASLMQEITDPDVPFFPDDRNRDRCLACPFFYACR